MHKKSKQVYVTHEPLTAHQILEKAAEILSSQFSREGNIRNAQDTKQYLTYKLAGNTREVFALLLLDSSHQVIEFKEMFYGTIDAASVYPREIIRAVLEANAAAVILAHNHPSGNTEPSIADQRLTQTIKNALALIDVRILDHIIVGETPVSFAELGLL